MRILILSLVLFLASACYPADLENAAWVRVSPGYYYLTSEERPFASLGGHIFPLIHRDNYYGAWAFARDADSPDLVISRGNSIVRVLGDERIMSGAYEYIGPDGIVIAWETGDYTLMRFYVENSSLMIIEFYENGNVSEFALNRLKSPGSKL